MKIKFEGDAFNKPTTFEYEVSISPLPKNCWSCPFYDWGDEVCNADRENEEEFNSWGVAVYRSLSCPFGTNHPDKKGE